jgi:hypothetical protein
MMYLFTIVSIIVDIFKRQASYEADVAEDKQKLTDLGIDVLSLEEELQKRLTSTSVFENADDQLLGEAFKLQPGEY